jgi:hypothetical protein
MRAQEESPAQTPNPMFAMFMCLPACFLLSSSPRAPVKSQEKNK